MKPFFVLALVAVLCSCPLQSQNRKKAFCQLSGPEKCWVIFHPFKAKRAYKISLEAVRIADSIQQTTLLDGDANGGQVDAFRHAFWMATLAQEIGRRSAKSLGKAHEKGNYKQFKKGKLEDGTLPDSQASAMDVYNNAVGIELYKAHKKATSKEYIELLVTKIKNGDLKILKKDPKGSYLDCNGQAISPNDYKGIWESPKCLIPSKK